MRLSLSFSLSFSLTLQLVSFTRLNPSTIGDIISVSIRQSEPIDRVQIATAIRTYWSRIANRRTGHISNFGATRWIQCGGLYTSVFGRGIQGWKQGWLIKVTHIPCTSGILDARDRVAYVTGINLFETRRYSLICALRIDQILVTICHLNAT